MENISLKTYFKDLRGLEILSADNQTLKAIEAKKGSEKSKEELIKSNLRFVVSIAKQYLYSGIPLEDLINEGNLGLIKAINKFNEDRECNFISYAVWWIRQAIMQSIYENSNLVRLPVNRISLNSKITKAKSVLFNNLNRDPTNGEVAEFMNVSEEDVKISHIDCGREVHLDSEVSEDSDSKFSDFMEGDGLQELEKTLNTESLKSEINMALSGLTEREGKILELYYGLDGDCERTLGEIGEVLGLTNERVRQIKEFALKKLRTYNKSSKLREFLSCKL